jgi:ABC-type multidrug transport system ATPase subunit
VQVVFLEYVYSTNKLIGPTNKNLYLFCSEPSAGIDPYNRRLVWDMIIAAKAGRSIILTTHFLDEADILSDRVGILKDGRLVACGSTLFLKHQIGGYSLSYEGADDFDLPSVLEGARAAEHVPAGSKKWDLQHGNESAFPDALRALERSGASNVSLELTSLEHVFLQAGKEDVDQDETADASGDNVEDDTRAITEVNSDLMKQIWKRSSSVPKQPLSWVGKLLLVTKFMFGNALRMKGLKDSMRLHWDF